MRPNPNADCPEERALQEVAAEIASPETSARVLQHAAQCNHCGPLLNQYLQDFSEELFPDLKAIVAQLPSAQPQWQREKAKELAGNVRSIWKRLWNRTAELWSAFKVPATAGAMATLLAGIGITRGPVIMNWVQLKSANGQVSAAFAQKRKIPGRFTGVASGQYQEEQGEMGSAGAADDPDWTAMKDADTALTHKLNSGGKVDPRWYQLMGRISLLKDPRHPKKARWYFQQAQNMGLKDLSLDIDLAVTSFQEESLLKKPVFQKTVDQLNIVLNAHPEPSPEEKKTALYNLAVTYEKMNDWGSAISTWDEYLKVDPAGAWADDARHHLEDDKKNAPSHSIYRSPSDYNRHSRDPAVRRDVEQYLQIALEQWLVLAIEDPASDAGKAVEKIAEDLNQQHDDLMLAHLLSFPGKERHPAQVVNIVFEGHQNTAIAGRTARENDRFLAIRALSAAVVHNKNDELKDAIDSSREAVKHFHKSGNMAGELLAGFQEIYALQRELDGEACLKRVDELWQSVFDRPYHWLQGQLALEKAICANRVFKSKPTEDGLAISRGQAADYHFPELKLRVIGMDVGIKRLNHHYKEAWWAALEGLDEYWKGDYSSSERYYQFYAVMREIAADSGYLHTSEAYLRRSIAVFETAAPNDTALQAVLYTSLANLTWELGEGAAAEAAARHARELMGLTPSGKTAVPAFFEMPAIELADFELRRHQPQRALSTLEQIGDSPQTPDPFVSLDFYRVRADAKLQLGRLDEAADDYRKGIAISQDLFKDRAKKEDKRLQGKPTNLQNEATLLQDEAKRLHWVRATSKIYAGFVQILLAKGQSEKALAVWEWSKSLFLDRTADRLLNEQQASAIPLLPTDYPHIVYASFEDRLQIWLVQSGRVLSKSVSVKQSDLMSRIRNFNLDCGNKDSLESEVERQGKELYELLLRPVIGGLATSHAGALENTVAVEFDDALPAFAVEALKNPAGRYFGEDYAVLQSPGILAERFLRPPLPLTPRDQFLVADASPEDGAEVLQGHELPAQAIRLIHSPTILKDARLTPQNVHKELRSSAALLVISHGLLGDEGMGLELTSDWSLRAKDFTPQLVPHLRLAVLAACSSGYSENGLLSPENLVRSLLAGGVPNAIASRWDVDSQSTGELFESFYTYLAQGETPTQALGHARRKLRTTDPDLLQGRPKRSHPYYWAGFYLTGKAS